MRLRSQLKELARRVLPDSTFQMLDNAWHQAKFGSLGHQEIFRKIYDQNLWRSSESVSGHGSTVAITKILRGELARWLRQEGVRSFVDLPCGDFNWMRLVDFPAGITYPGLDVVEPLIAENQSRYGRLGRAFGVADILTSELPQADVYFCKDLFYHFPNGATGAAISRAREKCRYFLASTFPNTPKNFDIRFGDCRCVNLALLLGEPVEMMKDFGGGVTDRYIGVWRGEL